LSTRKLEFTRGDVIADKYEVVDPLEEIPLGPTFRVKHLKSGKYVRLVLLRPKFAGREQKDAIIKGYKTARELNHTHLVKVGELGDHQGVGYITFEDFEGTTLRNLIQEFRASGKQFDVREAAQIAIQVLEALQVVHHAGLTVRALRPEYILVNVRYTGPRKQTFVAQTKLIGAGFWELVPTAVLAEDEFSRGEAQYMAPELKSFEPVPTPRSDVYSAGVILYEMITGAAPSGTFHAPKSRRPEVPDHLAHVIEVAIAHSPEERYPSADDFRIDIQRTFADAGAAADPAPRRPLLNPLGALLALVTLAAMAIILYNLRGDPEAENAARDSKIRADVAARHGKMPANLKDLLQTHPNMMYIPEGPYIAGRMYSEPRDIAMGSEPQAEVVELPAYFVDDFEYPNLAFGAPKFNVSYDDADKFCSDQGKRLCTAPEWEKACKGPLNYAYSYGDTFDPEYCGNGTEEIAPSGGRKDCRSGWGPGIFDLSGNFREWTSTQPPGNDKRRIVKGGLKANPQKGTRCAFAIDEAAAFAEPTLSFRCCMDATAPPPHSAPAATP
jgi:serine/threonine protein kinase